MVYPRRVPALTSSLTFGLLIANVIVFVLVIVGGDQSLLILAQTGELFFAGFYWQVFTAMFVHFDVTHIALNMFALVFFGRLVEGSYSRRQYGAIYFASGLAGNAASLFLLSPDVPTGGASGAIFGLIGAYAATERRGINLAIAILYAGLILLDSSSLFVGSGGYGVNDYAHLIGVLFGFGVGSVYVQGMKKKD